MPEHPLDAASRFGPAPTPEKVMHNNSTGDSVTKARQEHRRLSTKSTQKWMDAAERGEMMRIKQLLEDGQDINQVCQPSGSSALYVASRTNNLRLAEMLLEAGAEPGVLTDDLVSPCWIAISRGFDEMVKLLLEPRWNANLVEQIKSETTESLMQLENCGVQQTHYDLAVTRRFWKCVYHIESAIGVLPSATRIPEVLFEPPSGWAMGLTPAEPGQRPDMPMQFFYWEAFTKNGCREKPPPGSKKLVYKGQGIFEQESVVGEDGGRAP